MNNHIKIRFGDLLKTRHIGFNQKEVTIKAYVLDRPLCIVTVTNAYVAKTKQTQGNEMQMFVSFQKLHKVVSKETMSCWILEVMVDAGLDMNIFSPHSLKTTSISKALKAKIPINTILETVGWTRKSTFRAYCNKPVHEEGQLGIAVLTDNWYV